MLTRDIKGIYLPAVFLMLGLSHLVVGNFLSATIDADLGDPTVSDLAWIFYFVIHLILWFPVGITLFVIQLFRYRTSTIIVNHVFYQQSSSDNVRLVVGVVFGAFMVLVSSVILGDWRVALVIFIVSFVLNVVPAVVFFLLGTILTIPKRRFINKVNREVFPLTTLRF